MARQVAIGWIPVTKDGEPYRTTRQHYINGKVSNNPIKVYLTEAKAASYSPAKLAKPVGVLTS